MKLATLILALVATVGAAKLSHKEAAPRHNKTVHLSAQRLKAQRAATMAAADAARSKAMSAQESALSRSAAQFAKAARAARARRQAEKAHKAGEEKASCGTIASYPNAKPANYKDARATKYDKETKKTVPVTFSAGDKVEFKCEKGFSTDGNQDGETAFDVECTEHGYFKPSGVCMEFSPCGKLPSIEHAHPTGKVERKRFFEFVCDEGHSLDGQKVVAGGFQKNALFKLECIEFQAVYSKFEGKCQPYSFVPTGEVIRMYNEVFAVLFRVSCKGTIKDEFAKGKTPPGLDGACSKANLEGDCSGLVSKIKGDFDKQLAARKEFKEGKEEWHDSEKDIPGIDKEASEFCSKVWKLVTLPSLLQSHLLPQAHL